MEEEKTSLETERLCLEPLREEHRDAVFALSSDERVARFMRWDRHTRPEEAAELIRSYNEGKSRGFVIREKESGHMIGVLALKHGEDAREGEFSMSTFLAPDCWNKGYSSELMAAVKREANALVGARTLIAYVDGANAGSRRVLEKNGFQVRERLDFHDPEESVFLYAFQVGETVKHQVTQKLS